MAFRNYKNNITEYKTIEEILKPFADKPGVEKKGVVLYVWCWGYNSQSYNKCDNNDPKTLRGPIGPRQGTFHVVAGKAKADGSAPDQVYSKNGSKEVTKGPMSVENAKLKTLEHYPLVGGGYWIHRTEDKALVVKLTMEELKKVLAALNK